MTIKQLEALQVMARYSAIRGILNQKYDTKEALAFCAPSINHLNSWYDKVCGYIVDREYRELKRVMEGK